MPDRKDKEVDKIHVGYNGHKSTFFAHIFYKTDKVYPSVWIGQGEKEVKTSANLAERIKDTKAHFELGIIAQKLLHRFQINVEREMHKLELQTLKAQQNMQEHQKDSNSKVVDIKSHGMDRSR